MENCELTSHEMYNKLIKVFSELEEWTQKDINELKSIFEKEKLKVKFLKLNSISTLCLIQKN